DLRKNYDLPGDYKYDIIPEIWEGHNIADYIDPEILEKLEALEREEALREETGMYAVPKIEVDDNLREIRKLAALIRSKKAILQDEARVRKASTKPVMPRTTAPRARSRSVSRLKREMTDLGVDMSGTEEAHFMKTRGRSRSKSVSETPAKRARMSSEGPSGIRSLSRSMSRPPRNEMGVKDIQMKEKLAKIAHKAIKKKVVKKGLKGEADRFIGNKMPKHLFSGKRGMGKTDRR
ncbi:hypothetical protein R5R35_008697, partial [Gryllus longicercus]